MEKIEYRYRFWYRYRPKFMVSDWYRIEPKKAGIAHHYHTILPKNMAAALSRVYAGLCRRYRLTSKKCPFWFYSLFCGLDLVFQNKQETWLLETAQICIKTCRFWILRWPNGDIQEP
jgi:hypothetical protein